MTSYNCILYQISRLKFHPISDNIAVVISSECQERVWYICSVQTPGSTCAIKDLHAEDVSDHLNGCFKTVYRMRSIAVCVTVLKPLTHTRMSKRNGNFELFNGKA